MRIHCSNFIRPYPHNIETNTRHCGFQQIHCGSGKDAPYHAPVTADPDGRDRQPGAIRADLRDIALSAPGGHAWPSTRITKLSARPRHPGRIRWVHPTSRTSSIAITNSDGTITQALGSFVLINGFIFSGTISELRRTSDGNTIEMITGLSLDALAFVSAAPADKLPMAFAGTDTLNGILETRSSTAARKTTSCMAKAAATTSWRRWRRPHGGRPRRRPYFVTETGDVSRRRRTRARMAYSLRLPATPFRQTSKDRPSKHRSRIPGPETTSPTPSTAGRAPTRSTVLGEMIFRQQRRRGHLPRRPGR